MRTGFAILLFARFPALASLPSPGAELRYHGFRFPGVRDRALFLLLGHRHIANSLGSISHYYQVMTLMLLGQSMAAWLWAASAQNRREAWTRSPAALHSFTIRVTLQVLAGN